MHIFVTVSLVLATIVDEKQHLFPNYCYFCKKNRITVKKKEEYPTNIVTYEAQETLVKVATEKNDFELLGAIKDVDLIAGEFKKHKSCYKSYTRTCSMKIQPSETVYEKGNFEAVCSVIDVEVLNNSKSLSIDTLLSLYRKNIDDVKQYRYYLKKRIESQYGDEIMFLSPGYRKPDVVISKLCVEASSLSQCFEHAENNMVTKVAKLLRKYVLDTVRESSDMTWPPDVDKLNAHDRKPPEILQHFYRILLGFNKPTEKSVRIVDSLCADILYNISNGKFITLKHTSVGLGLHSLTGMKTPITQLHRLGHSISYDMICRIETGQAELAQQQLKTSTILPLQPINQEAQVSEITTKLKI